MKQKIFAIIPILALLFFFGSACNRENPVSPSVGLPNTTQKVQANVIGRVIDDTGLSVAGATVKLGKEATTTNAQGFFYFHNSPMPADYGYVTVTKPGYFLGSRTFTVTNGRTESVYIKLLPKTQRGSFNAAAGGAVTFSGCSVTIPGNGVVGPDGLPYFGMVRVAGQYLSPEATDLGLIMPGDLLGYDAANQRQLMKTWGMLAVELIGDAGEKLQIATGSEATIELPVAPTQTIGAPSELPLWYFDEAAGFWKQEGTATLQNGKFVGKVKHFSFWNCDTPQAAISLTMTVVDINGNPLPNLYVSLTSTVYGSRGGITDNMGHVSGLVPSNDPMVMTIWDNAIGQSCIVLPATNIGPYAVSTNIGNVVVNNSAIVSTTVMGTVQDCAGNAVTNGVVSMAIGTNYPQVVFVNNGTYSFTYVSCSPSISATLTATDLTNFVQNTPVTVTLAGGAITQNMTACGTAITEYININTNGNPYAFVDGNIISCVDSTGNSNILNVSASIQNGGGFAYINYQVDNSTNPATINYFNYYTTTLGTNATFTVNPTSVVVSNWPAGVAGQYFDCSFSGTYNDPANSLVNAPFNVVNHIKHD